MLDLISGKVIQRMRPRSDQAHVPLQYIPQLRELIQAVASQKTSQACNARIIRHLEKWPRSLVSLPQSVFQRVRIAHHGAKFVAADKPPLPSRSPRAIERRSQRVQLDQPRDQ